MNASSGWNGYKTHVDYIDVEGYLPVASNLQSSLVIQSTLLVGIPVEEGYIYLGRIEFYSSCISVLNGSGFLALDVAVEPNDCSYVNPYAVPDYLGGEGSIPNVR